MQTIIRCPECGSRLTTNECPMCMKKVPFPGLQKSSRTVNWQSRKYESPYEEDHTCVSFDEGQKAARKKKTLKPIIADAPGSSPRRKSQTQKNKKQVTLVAVVIAVLSLLSSLVGLFESIPAGSPEPEPDTYVDAYIPNGGIDAVEFSAIIPAQIYNANDISVTVDSSGSYYDDYAIAVTVVNNTDQNVTISSDMLSVNGYMMPSSGLFIQVEGGETCQDYLRLYSYDLEDAGIQQVANVAFCLDIYDSDEYTDIDQTDLITLETDAAKDFVQTVDDSGRELYNDGTVRILLKETELSNYGDCTMTLFVENTSDKMVSVSDNGILINGQVSSGILWSTLRPNTRAIDSIYFYEMEDLDISDLTQMEEVSIELHIEYMEDWSVEETVNTTIVFDPVP